MTHPAPEEYIVFVSEQVAHFVVELVGLEARIFGESRLQLDDLTGVILAHPVTKEVLAYALCSPQTRPDGSLSVYTFAVNPKYRRRGYGTVLLHHLTARYGYFSDLLVCIPLSTPDYNIVIQMLSKVGFRVTYRHTYIDPKQASITTTMVRHNEDYVMTSRPHLCCMLQ